MSSTMATSRVRTGRGELSRAAVMADLRGLGWRPLQNLLTYDVEEDPTFEEDIPRTV
jgi:hypothetical protein